MRMPRDPLLRAWGTLIGLSLGSTLLSLAPVPPGLSAVAGALILGLAWLKARVILGRYLGLVAAPFWHRGFGISLAGFCLLLLGLYLAAGTAHPRRICAPSPAISGSNTGKDVAMGLASSTLTGAFAAMPITRNDMAIR